MSGKAERQSVVFIVVCCQKLEHKLATEKEKSRNNAKFRSAAQSETEGKNETGRAGSARPG